MIIDFDLNMLIFLNCLIKYVVIIQVLIVDLQGWWNIVVLEFFLEFDFVVMC